MEAGLVGRWRGQRKVAFTSEPTDPLRQNVVEDHLPHRRRGIGASKRGQGIEGRRVLEPRRLRGEHNLDELPVLGLKLHNIGDLRSR